MDARTTRQSNLHYWLGVALVALFASILTADAKCTIRSGDPLIKARYQGCNPRAFISYLYNDLITPYSFKCAKTLKATCQNEGCEHPATEAEARRCLDRFSEVLTSCNQQIDDAARMAKCTDTKAWPVEQILAQFVASMPKTAVASTAPATTATATSPITYMPVLMPPARANNPTQASVSAKSLPRSNGPLTASEKAEIQAAKAADAEAEASAAAQAAIARAAAAATATTPAATAVTPSSTAAFLDTTSPPATPTALSDSNERAPAGTTETSTAAAPTAPNPAMEASSSVNTAPAAPPASPSVKVEPLPGEAFEVARKPARTSQRSPRTRYPVRN
ncbi:MAG: hypothetical protein JST04_00055 [Bdellovibrionales bacterium]|nr:hypothetical protein [Bdellovibrionales bacterium]